MTKKILTLLVFFKPTGLSDGIWSKPSRDAALLYTPFCGTYSFQSANYKTMAFEFFMVLLNHDFFSLEV